MSGQPTVDFLSDRREHTRGIRKSQAAGRVRQPILCRPFTCNRRLDSRHERHTALLSQILHTRACAVDRQSTDPHTRTDCAAPARNCRVRAPRQLGTTHKLPRYRLHLHRRPLRKRSRRSRCGGAHSARNVQHHRHKQKKRTRGPTTALRPHEPAGGMQQKIRMERRHHSSADPEPVRKETDHISTRRHHLPQRRHIP